MKTEIPMRPDLEALPSRRKDGRKKHPLFDVWRGIKKRCFCPTSHGYENYGARGITMHPQWRDDFWEFVSAVGERPSPQHTIDRFPDNNGNYEPGNVRWATRSQQMENTRFNRMISANGKTQTAEAWAKETGIPKSTIFNRILRGWTDDRIVNNPRQKQSSDNSFFPVGGRSLCTSMGINYFTVASRMRRGKSFEEALVIPVAKQKGGRSHARLQPQS